MFAELFWSVRCKIRTGLMCFRKYETTNICILAQTLSYLLLNFGGACAKLFIAFEIAFTNMTSRSNVGNTCPHLVQNLSSSLLPKYVQIIIYIIVILPVVLYGCETWSVTFREGHRLRVLEERVLRRMFGPKRKEVCMLRGFVICTAYRIL